MADGSLALSRRLVELKTDVDAGRDWDELIPSAPDEAEWRALCERYDFRNLSGALRDFSAAMKGGAGSGAGAESGAGSGNPNLDSGSESESGREGGGGCS